MPAPKPASKITIKNKLSPIIIVPVIVASLAAFALLGQPLVDLVNSYLPENATGTEELPELDDSESLSQDEFKQLFATGTLGAPQVINGVTCYPFKGVYNDFNKTIAEGSGFRTNFGNFNGLLVWGTRGSAVNAQGGVMTMFVKAIPNKHSTINVRPPRKLVGNYNIKTDIVKVPVVKDAVVAMDLMAYEQNNNGSAIITYRVDSSRRIVRFGVYFSSQQKTKFYDVSGKEITGATAGLVIKETDKVTTRLERKGNVISAYANINGVEKLIGKQNNAITTPVTHYNALIASGPEGAIGYSEIDNLYIDGCFQ